MKKNNYLMYAQLIITLCTLASPSFSHCKRLTQPMTAQRTTSTLYTPEIMDKQRVEEIQEEIAEEPIQRSAPSTWTMIYNLLPQIIIQGFSTGTDAGIGAFTKTLTKQFMQKRAFNSMKNDVLNEIENNLKKENLIIPETEKITFMKDYFSRNKIDFDQMQQQTSTSFIMSSAASTALVYTFSAMMGSLLKIGIGIGLQLLAPQSH